MSSVATFMSLVRFLVHCLMESLLHVVPSRLSFMLSLEGYFQIVSGRLSLMLSLVGFI